MNPVVARALLVVMAALWGLTFVANHELLATLDAMQIAVLRFVAVSTGFGALLLARPELRPRFTRRDWGVVLLSGLFAVPGAQLALVHGQNFLAPGLTGLVVATGPAIVAVLSVLVLGERLRARQVAGFLIALGGAAAVILVASGRGSELTVRNPWGASLTAFAQLCWALYTIVSKPFAARQAPITAVATAVIVGTLLLAPLYPHAWDGLDQVQGAQWLWLAHLAIGGTIVPYLIYFSSLRTLDANRTGAYLNLVPFFGILWSALILGQEVTVLAVLAGAVIMVGVVLTQARAPAVAEPVGDVEGGVRVP